VVLDAPSEDDVDDALVINALPARFFAVDLEDLSWGPADS
jgi:hypothetical protein